MNKQYPINSSINFLVLATGDGEGKRIRVRLLNPDLQTSSAEVREPVILTEQGSGSYTSGIFSIAVPAEVGKYDYIFDVVGSGTSVEQTVSIEVTAAGTADINPIVVLIDIKDATFEYTSVISSEYLIKKFLNDSGQFVFKDLKNIQLDIDRIYTWIVSPLNLISQYGGKEKDLQVQFGTRGGQLMPDDVAVIYKCILNNYGGALPYLYLISNNNNNTRASLNARYTWRYDEKTNKLYTTLAGKYHIYYLARYRPVNIKRNAAGSVISFDIANLDFEDDIVSEGVRQYLYGAFLEWLGVVRSTISFSKLPFSVNIADLGKMGEKYKTEGMQIVKDNALGPNVYR